MCCYPFLNCLYAHHYTGQLSILTTGDPRQLLACRTYTYTSYTRSIRDPNIRFLDKSHLQCLNNLTILLPVGFYRYMKTSEEHLLGLKHYSLFKLK